MEVYHRISLEVGLSSVKALKSLVQVCRAVYLLRKPQALAL